jgi:hypothetical protein
VSGKSRRANIRTILLLRSGASADRRKLVCFFQMAALCRDAATPNAANLAALKLKGWTDADTTAFVAARQSLGTVNVTQQTAKGGAKVTTGQKDADAADLYERLLTIQNAADLQWPATDPANAGVRDAFCLNTFPPTQSHGSGPQPPAPVPATTPAPGK